MNEEEEEEVEWGVGLGLGLSDRQRWPPGGAELNLALRSTMASSLSELVEEKSRYGEGRREADDMGGGGSNEAEFWEGVEKRVGFSVRDLDQGEGEGSEWLNPQSVQSVLVSLCLEYSLGATSLIEPLMLPAHFQSVGLLVHLVQACFSHLCLHLARDSEQVSLFFSDFLYSLPLFHLLFF